MNQDKHHSLTSPPLKTLDSNANKNGPGYFSDHSSNNSSPTSEATTPLTSSKRAGYPPRQAIALISDHGDPAAVIGRDGAGGQNVYVRQVGEALAKLGWQVDMFTRQSSPEDPQIVQHSPFCRTIRLTAGSAAFIPRDQLFQYMPEFVAAFQRFQTQEGTNYPLIHTNYWMSAWVGLQLKQQSSIQLIHTYHSLGAVKYRTIDSLPTIAQTRLHIEQQILEQADCVVATSPQEEEHLRSLVSSQGAIEVIPCGTDTQTFRRQSRSEARQQLGLAPHEKIVLYVGRFDPRKGIETLVRAFAQLAIPSDTDVKLLLVGGWEPGQSDDQEQQRIRQLVADLGIADRTIFAGQVDHEHLPMYYTAADVCGIPSDYEPFGLVAIEAMACGTPVVASSVGGLKFTVIPEETGLLVPPRDVDAFAQALDRLLSDTLWTQKVRRQAAARVQQNFSWTGVGIQLSDLYRRLLAQSLTHPTCMNTAYMKAS